MHLLAQPLCVRCQSAGFIVSATLVDHVIPISKGGAPLERGNLQSLCKPCHARKTSVEGGRW